MARVVSRIRAATPKFSSLILYGEKATRLDQRTSGKDEQRLETKKLYETKNDSFGAIIWK